MASSTEHCVSAPPAPTCEPMSTARALDGASPVHGHGGLDLAEAEGDRGGGVGGQQQRVVETVGDVRLAGRRAAHAHLGDRHLQLDGAQERDDARELGGGRAAGEADDVLPGRARVDDEAGELDVVEAGRLPRHRRVDAVRGDERVDEVEAGGGHAVQLSDAAGRVDLDGGLGIVRARERDEPRVVVLVGEAVKVDRARVEADEAAETRGLFGGRGISPPQRGVTARGSGGPPTAGSGRSRQGTGEAPPRPRHGSLRRR